MGVDTTNQFVVVNEEFRSAVFSLSRSTRRGSLLFLCQAPRRLNFSCSPASGGEPVSVDLTKPYSWTIWLEGASQYSSCSTIPLISPRFRSSTLMTNQTLRIWLY